VKYERQFTETVEAERIPLDPTLSELERLRAFTGCLYTVAHDADDHITICWDVEGRIVFSEPGNWITKDAENCLTWWDDADFRTNFHEIEPNLDDVLPPLPPRDELLQYEASIKAQNERRQHDEWVNRPPVLNYG
jgi:hypothetical protein